MTTDKIIGVGRGCDLFHEVSISHIEKDMKWILFSLSRVHKGGVGIAEI